MAKYSKFDPPKQRAQVCCTCEGCGYYGPLGASRSSQRGAEKSARLRAGRDGWSIYAGLFGHGDNLVDAFLCPVCKNFCRAKAEEAAKAEPRSGACDTCDYGAVGKRPRRAIEEPCFSSKGCGAFACTGWVAISRDEEVLKACLTCDHGSMGTRYRKPEEEPCRSGGVRSHACTKWVAIGKGEDAEPKKMCGNCDHGDGGTRELTAGSTICAACIDNLDDHTGWVPIRAPAVCTRCAHHEMRGSSQDCPWCFHPNNASKAGVRYYDGGIICWDRNPDGKCPDFERATGEAPRSCETCRWMSLMCRSCRRGPALPDRWEPQP